MSILYKVTYGYQTGLCRAVDGDDAYDYMERRIGLDNGPIEIEGADETDEAHFKAMGGGYIYTTPAARKEDKEACNESHPGSVIESEVDV